MKIKTRNFLLAFLMLLTLVFGVFTIMPMTASAAGETQSEVVYDSTVRVTTFAEMKDALEEKKDTHVIVHNFEQASGRSYYPLIYGIDYEDMDSEDIGYKAVITTPAGYDKRLTIHGDVDIRATDTNHPILNFILNKGNLVLDGSGSLHVDFNAGAFVSSIIFNMGELTVNRDESSNRPLTLNAEQKTLQTHGYAIYQYGGSPKLTINAGNFIGYNDNMENAEHTNSATAIYINNSGKGVVINGGTFSSKTSVSHYVCYGISFDYDVDASKVAINGGEIHGIRTSIVGDKTLHPELTTFLGEGMKAYKLSDDTQMSASTKTTTEAFYVLNPNNKIDEINITIPYEIGAEYTLPTLPEGVVLRSYGWTHGFGTNHTTIRPDVAYEVCLYLNPAVGYTFGKNPTVKINGKQVTKATLYDDYTFRIDNTFDELYYEPENIAIDVTGYDVGKLSSSVGFTTGTDGVAISQSNKVVNGGNSEAIQANKAYTASFVLTPKAGYTLANVTKDDISLKVGTVNGGTVNYVEHNSNGSLTVEVALKALPSTIGAIELTYEGYLGGKYIKDSYPSAEFNVGIEFTGAFGIGYYLVDSNYSKILTSNTDTFVANNNYYIAVNIQAKSGYQFPDDPTITMADATLMKPIEKSGNGYIAYFALPACTEEITLNGFEVDINGLEYGKNTNLEIVAKTQGIVIKQPKVLIYNGSNYEEFNGALVEGTDYYVYFVVDVEEGYKLLFDYTTYENRKNIIANYNGSEMRYHNMSTANNKQEMYFKIGTNSIGGTLESYGDNEVIKITLYQGTTIAYPYRTIELVGNNVEYAFNNLPSGNYQIKVEKAGHETYKSTYTDGVYVPGQLIEASGAVDYDIKLTHLCSATTVSENKAGCSTAADSIYYACVCGTCYSDSALNNKIADIAAFIASKGGHDYSEKISDSAHLKHEAINCTESNQYWYDCSRCEANAKYDENATTAFYTDSEKKGEHNFTKKIADDDHLVEGTGVHCQSAKEYYYSCEHCDAIGIDEEPWVSTVVGDHIMNETYTQKDDKHFHACSVLGCDYTDTPVSCSGGTATCQAKAVCDTCKNAYGDKNMSNHTSAEYTYTTNNNDTHIKKNACCGTVVGNENCSGGSATCTTKKTCEKCNTAYGDFAPHSHDSAWKKDETGHWNECVCGDKANFAGHNPDRANATETEPVKCTICEYIITPALGHTTHTPKVEWESDENNHWHECTGCEGQQLDKAAHVDSDNNGKCDTCEYDMPTTPGGGSGSETPEKPDEPKDGLGTGAIVVIAVGSVAVVGIGGFALVWFVIKKKTWAEFIAIFKKK